MNLSVQEGSGRKDDFLGHKLQPHLRDYALDLVPGNQ